MGSGALEGGKDHTEAEDKQTPYQGGDDDQAHSQRDQQQTWDPPGPRAQPGLGNIRQSGQCTEGLEKGSVLIYFILGLGGMHTEGLWALGSIS